MKRLIALFLILLMTAGMLSGCGTGTDGDFKFRLNDDKKSYTLVEYLGDDKDVVIPGEFRNKPVTMINNAFMDNTDVETVEIPDSVSVIGSESFRNCSSLKSVEIPDSVCRIEDYTFSCCASLEEIIIPQGAEIGWYTFLECDNLKYVELGTEGNENDEYSITRSAFEGCDSLKEVRIGECYVEVGWNSFALCESLTTMYLPASLKTIGYNSLLGCTSLTDIYYAGTAEDWQNVEIDELSGVHSGIILHTSDE